MHWATTQVQYASTAQRIRTALSRHVTHAGQTPSYLRDKQGELEHRTSKARFRRTDKKQFVKQMAGIERCEARIRYIRNLNNPSCHGQGERSCERDRGPGRLRDKEESRRLPATGVDTTKIRVQSADVHTRAYVRTVQYESRER